MKVSIAIAEDPTPNYQTRKVKFAEWRLEFLPQVNFWSIGIAPSSRKSS